MTAAVRIKPLLERDDVQLRQAAFQLLGDLADSVGPNEGFKDQVYGNLIALILHLQDEDQQVIKVYFLR